MSLRKLNLTQIKVTKELDILALVHPSQTYRILLNNPEFRQNLLNYILQRIPHQYLLIESKKEYEELIKIIKYTNQEKIKIHNLIHQRFNELRKRKLKPLQINTNLYRFYSLILEDERIIS